MDLGTAPLFDLPAPLGVEADDAAAVAAEQVVTRSQELLASIRERRTLITDQEIATLREIAEWALEHVVDDEADVIGDPESKP